MLVYFLSVPSFFFHLTYNSKLSKQNSFKEEWAGIQNCKCNKRFYLSVCHELPQIVLDFTINHSIYWNLLYTLHLHALTVNINLYSGCSFYHLLGQGSYGKKIFGWYIPDRIPNKLKELRIESSQNHDTWVFAPCCSIMYHPLCTL